MFLRCVGALCFLGIGLQVGGHRYDVPETKKIAAKTSALIRFDLATSAQATYFTDEANIFQFQTLFPCSGNSPAALLAR
jgi:hypothetical protein